MKGLWIVFALSLIAAITPAIARAQSAPESVLTPLRQRDVEAAADRALKWLATNQRPDGAFRGIDTGQPGVTGLSVLAFLSRGHLPGQGPYGAHLDRAIRFVLAQQRSDGLIQKLDPEPVHVGYGASHSAVYNHAISALALTEAYGMSTDRALAAKMRDAINRARACTLAMQVEPKELPKDRGGWRYLRRLNENSSDLSVTSWQMLFLRSAKNAGFDVPADRMDEASAFVERCFLEDLQRFSYLAERDRPVSRAMAGAGILSLALAGKYDTPHARIAADWILAHGFDEYRASLSEYDRYFYSLFYCTQAMFQMGGRYWKQFYPHVVDVLLANQHPEGNWDADVMVDDQYGNGYTTALCVMALQAPNQLLPIFQR